MVLLADTTLLTEFITPVNPTIWICIVLSALGYFCLLRPKCEATLNLFTFIPETDKQVILEVAMLWLTIFLFDNIDYDLLLFLF